MLAKFRGFAGDLVVSWQNSMSFRRECGMSFGLQLEVGVRNVLGGCRDLSCKDTFSQVQNQPPRACIDQSKKCVIHLRTILNEIETLLEGVLPVD